VRLEVVHVDVLALVGLVRVAFYGFGLAILAGNDILVGALLFEAVPLLVVVVAGFLVVGPCSLAKSVWRNCRCITELLTSFASIILAMTAPEVYSSLEYMAPEASGSSAAATETNFILM
jgi:hypothetical protein